MKLPGTATQEENIHIAMGKLNIHKDNVFLDIGCGSGAVSEAAMRFTDKIYGIDSRPEAVAASKLKVPSGIFLKGEASELLSKIPRIDRCFIGGTRNINEFFPMLIEKANPGFVVVSDLARLGMASKVVALMKKYGIFQEFLQIQISRGYELSGDLALKSVNPIFIVVGKC
ncbi:MAG: methyltransferase domain-containing protein [Methanotrichaceae archaeon]|nr:methyltransferase domain-containing protein [Methanotrichaceae archaeon]MDD1757348.1 methyltransferase domain-containing protein [Methanotrichaceae archaeon]